MTKHERIDFIAAELRTLAREGEQVPGLLRRIQELVGQQDCKLISLQSFRQAFLTSIASISPICGWSGFGGSLSDDEINSLVMEAIEVHRQEWLKALAEQDHQRRNE